MTHALLSGSPALTLAEDTQETITLRSGPGAPMFDPGEHARIRRAPVRAIASFTFLGGPREAFGQVLNISPGGCLLKTETTIPAGTLVSLEVLLVGGGRQIQAELEGVVRRRVQNDGRQAYGLEFLSDTHTDRQTAQWLYMQAMR